MKALSVRQRRIVEVLERRHPDPRDVTAIRRDLGHDYSALTITRDLERLERLGEVECRRKDGRRGTWRWRRVSP